MRIGITPRRTVYERPVSESEIASAHTPEPSDWRKLMPTWDVRSSGSQPTISLVRWTVVRFRAKEIQADLVFGWDIENSCGRASSVIESKEPRGPSVRTRTGRAYRLLGSACADAEGDYVFRQKYAELIALCAFTDVSSEYEMLAIPCAII